ncbi:MAG: DUF1778 domain-containing protein [Synergistaceae bacterium]|jgi:uncharacterized protein (DUF1778 family)|nr:DUF1778 domain-containing protein [Synergistaceae bacterium]
MPMRNVIPREDRLSIRIPRGLKEDLVRAAAISGVTLGDFVIANTARAAVKIIQSHQLIELSARDYDGLMEALKETSKPNPSLLKAAKDYKRAVADGDLAIED